MAEQQLSQFQLTHPPCCCQCEHWQSKRWNGYSFDDATAFCPIKNEETGRREECKQGKWKTITAVRELHETASKLKVEADKTDVDVATLMEQWYEKHRTEFEDVGDLRDTDETKVVYKGTQDFDYKKVLGELTEEEERIIQLCLSPSNRGDRMFYHQQEDFIRYKDATEDGLFLEQGCGKSAITLRIGAYLWLHKKIDSILVIAPNDVHRQWAIEQIPLWLPEAIPREVQCFGGRGGLKDCHPFRYDDHLHIVCVNVDTFSTPHKWEDVAMWVKLSKCFVVLDEATSIKNISAKRTERILYEFNDVVRKNKRILSSTVKTVGRAILTGTPITNGITDLWCLMEFLRPDYFSRNWYSFRNRYAMLASITTPYGSTQIMLTKNLWEAVKEQDEYEKAYMLFGVTKDTYDTIQMQDHYQGAYKHEEELRELIKPVSTFRVLKDCVDMPPQTFNKRVVTMGIDQAKAYKDMENQLLAQYGGAITTAANKITALTRLSQISSGFIVQGNFVYNPDDFELRGDDFYDLEPGDVKWFSGVPKLDELERDVAESQGQVIIITRFSAEASRIYEDLQKDYSCLLYTGWKKTGAIEEFKEGKKDVLVANIRCVSRGFNLQNSCKMFFYSNTYSLEDRLQTEGRIFRIGQKQPCMYNDYINEGTVDNKIVGALRQRRGLLDYVRGVSLTSFVQDEDEITEVEEYT